MAGKLDVDKTVHDVVKIADDEMARLMKRYKWR
jgi:hypothetical protein